MGRGDQLEEVAKAIDGRSAVGNAMWVWPDTRPGTRRTVPGRATTVAMPNQDRSDKHEGVMSKGMDQKKGTKKEPTKTLKEKRAAKAEKKNK